MTEKYNFWFLLCTACSLNQGHVSILTAVIHTSWNFQLIHFLKVSLTYLIGLKVSWVWSLMWNFSRTTNVKVNTALKNKILHPMNSKNFLRITLALIERSTFAPGCFYAAPCGKSFVHVSLHWVGNVMTEVNNEQCGLIQALERSQETQRSTQESQSSFIGYCYLTLSY